jgi:hypothetical protein
MTYTAPTHSPYCQTCDSNYHETSEHTPQDDGASEPIHPNDEDDLSGLWAIEIDDEVRLCTIEGWTAWGTEEVEIDIRFDLPYHSDASGHMRYGFTTGRVDRLRRPTHDDLAEAHTAYENAARRDQTSAEIAQERAAQSTKREQEIWKLYTAGFGEDGFS